MAQDLTEAPAEPNRPVLRFAARAQSIEGIEHELARMWSTAKLTTMVDGHEERHIAARTSVMNLVVIARRPETGEHCAAIVSELTGRHPSRTLIVSSADPDGPSWLDAQVRAHCMLPRDGQAEVCAESIYLTAGGESGRHLMSVVAPLLIHDLPVTVWWPGEPPFRSPTAAEVLHVADRLVVDGSAWSGEGLARLAEMVEAARRNRLAVFDFALTRQSRWREAIASVFDLPEFLPYLRHLRRVAVTYATHDPSGRPGGTNVVKPAYHVAWLASRLGMTVARPLAPVERGPARASAPVRPSAAVRPPARAPRAGGGGEWRAVHPVAMHRGLGAALRTDAHDVSVLLRPVLSEMPGGTTLRVELLCRWRSSELRADVTAEAENVHARVWQDGIEVLERTFRAPRRTEADLLAEAIEATAPDPVADGTFAAVEALVGDRAREPEPAASSGVM
ncbi:MAG TPA: glucose-6-phosphate dehydrogenase assembly protein OpcA [Candidatus Limnocylindrales bacterium]|nr:glucose-6-phosphate dehydrogenase assembly protein OpcA [Candidatus Limnocylindrales bacterium]